MPLNTPQRRSAIIWIVIIVSMLAVVFWRFTGIPFPKLQLRILIAVVGTAAGVMSLYKGILLGFSKHGGWGAAAVPLLWAAVMFVIAFDALAGPGERARTMPFALLAAVLAVIASVLAQRNKERSEVSGDFESHGK